VTPCVQANGRRIRGTSVDRPPEGPTEAISANPRSVDSGHVGRSIDAHICGPLPTETWEGSIPNFSSALLMVRGTALGFGMGVSIGISLVLIVTGGASLLGTAGKAPSPATASQLALNSSTPRVHSESWAVGAGPTVTTPSISVPKGSDLFVFVGFVPSSAGGGSVASINDSSSDHFHQAYSTKERQNHTATLYVASNVKRSSVLQVSVMFTGGSTVFGGSVSVVDVVGAAAQNPIAVRSGEGGRNLLAYVALSTNQTNDLFLFGVDGNLKDGPFTAGAHERLVATGGNDSGPFQDGTSFGTFSSVGRTGTFLLYAFVNKLADTIPGGPVWAAIGVGIQP